MVRKSSFYFCNIYIFKTIVDPFIGKYSLIKVGSGVLKQDDVLYNEERGMDDMDLYFFKEPLPDLSFSPDSNYGICRAEKGILQWAFHKCQRRKNLGWRDIMN